MTNVKDEQTKRAVEQAERAESTAEKHRRSRSEASAGRYGREGKAEGREGEAGDDPRIEGLEPGPDGTIHLMEAELLAGALQRDAPEAEQQAQPRTVHIMEAQMKGEALGEYADNMPKPDNTLPEEPLPGKPPEPPLEGSRKGDERKPEPVQYPADNKRK